MAENLQKSSILQDLLQMVVLLPIAAFPQHAFKQIVLCFVQLYKLP